ncbi:retroviral-like aspartic protease family protein [Candidatus Amesbacteria bacterium]|nr:retroviral-like aspartic protease family protein [Candidatus Amesbacteria bacterium]MBI2587630.1 retroviral-like aspartic protease family protein [Candidatus Amesbacteria bacterium]
MGIVNASLKIINPRDTSKIYQGDFLVDTGAKYTVIPKHVWQRLELKPDRHQKFSLADGKIISRPIGSAFIKYRGIKSSSPIILGGPKDDFLLGIVTLENLGLGINPFTRELYQAKLMM